MVPVGDTGVLIEADGFSTPSIFFNLNLIKMQQKKLMVKKLSVITCSSIEKIIIAR